MKSRQVATYSLYLTLFLLFGLVPNVGYLSIGPIAVTTMALPITLITMHKGFKGAIFGIVCFASTSAFALPYRGQVFVAALGIARALLLVIGSRMLILVPLGAYLLLTSKTTPNPYLNGAFITLIISVFNTVFVLALLVAWGFQGKTFISLFVLLGLTNILPEWTIIPVLGSGVGWIALHLKKRDAVFKTASYS